MDFQWVMGMKKGQPQTKLSPCAGEGHTTQIFKESKRHKDGLQATTDHISKNVLFRCFLFLSLI